MPLLQQLSRTRERQKVGRQKEDGEEIKDSQDSTSFKHIAAIVKKITNKKKKLLKSAQCHVIEMKNSCSYVRIFTIQHETVTRVNDSKRLSIT